MPIFTATQLRRFVEGVLTAAGLTDEEAQVCADAAVFANLRGTDTHGIVYIVPRTLQSIRAGRTVPGAEPVVVRESGATALLKGNGLAGPVLGQRAMRLAMAKAQQHGIGAVVTFQGNPLGLLGYYPALALDEGLFALVMANTSPAVAPYRSSTRVFGTNPFAFAAPTSTEQPVLFDIATSVAAAGKLAQAQRRGERLPEGWVIDAEGRWITDPAQVSAGALMPFGGHKGSGIALLVHLLTGVLAGTTVGGEPTHEHPDERIRGQSTFFLAIDPQHFHSRAAFRALVDRQIEQLHRAVPLPGFTEVLAPGERGWRLAAQRAAEGIPIANEDWSAVLAAISQAGLCVEDLLERYAPHLRR